MKKSKFIITFALCLILILSFSVLAYAIGAKALTEVLFYQYAVSITEPSWAQFNTGDIFRISTQVTGSDNELWWYGVPGVDSNPYSFLGERYGYSRVYGIYGNDLFTFNLT